MAGQSDSTQQNIAAALGTLAQTYLSIQGTRNATALTAATLVALSSQTSPRRICSVSVLVAGVAGAIYDAASAAATTGKVYVIPATVGVFIVNFPLSFGLVVAPGAGQTVSVSYS